MELRLLLIAARILDPRLWRRRLRQLASGLGVLGWIWFRAVNRAEVVRAVADVSHDMRAERIRRDNVERELDRLSA